jgi:hypothetical protein
MGISYVRPGWVTYIENGEIKEMYGREWGSNSKEVDILYNGDNIKTLKRTQIIREEEDTRAKDYDSWWHGNS